jgi:hypothetical protein
MAATTSTVDIIGGNLPFGYCYPPSAQQFLEDIAQRMSATMPGGSTFVFGQTAPKDTGLPWLKTNSDGSIDGWYTFMGGLGISGQGAWVRPYPISADSRQHWLWSGLETDLWLLDGGDGTDPSVPANIGPAHGSFWEADHGFDRRMPLGPDPQATPPINVGDSGGLDGIVLDGSHIPPHTHTIPIFFNDAWDGAVAGNPNDRTGLFWFPDYNRTPLGSAINPATGNNSWPFCQGSIPPASATDCYFFDTTPFGTGTLGAKLPLVDPYRATYVIARTSRKYITG